MPVCRRCQGVLFACVFDHAGRVGRVRRGSRMGSSQPESSGASRHASARRPEACLMAAERWGQAVTTRCGSATGTSSLLGMTPAPLRTQPCRSQTCRNCFQNNRAMANHTMSGDDPQRRLDRFFDCLAYLLAGRWIEDHKTIGKTVMQGLLPLPLPTLRRDAGHGQPAKQSRPLFHLQEEPQQHRPAHDPGL
jgi:hypothetical protein